MSALPPPPDDGEEHHRRLTIAMASQLHIEEYLFLAPDAWLRIDKLPNQS